MNFSQFFIQRPIFAAVLSLLILSSARPRPGARGTCKWKSW